MTGIDSLITAAVTDGIGFALSRPSEATIKLVIPCRQRLIGGLKMKLDIRSAIAILVLSCGASACYDVPDATVSTGPSSFVNRLEFVGVGSGVLTRQIVPNSVCPRVQPFSVPIALNVRANVLPITLTEVRIHATDPFEIQSPITIFDNASLTRNFASATVDRFGVRTFPLIHDFGCGMSGNVVVHISATTTDGGGTVRTSMLDVPVQ
jgi:hypothetical protein